MPDYKFDKWKSKIINPTITFPEVDSAGDPIVRNINKADMTIEVQILMTTADGSEFGPYELDEISIQNLTYTTAQNVMDRVVERLQDFIV